MLVHYIDLAMESASVQILALRWIDGYKERGVGSRRRRRRKEMGDTL